METEETGGNETGGTEETVDVGTTAVDVYNQEDRYSDKYSKEDRRLAQQAAERALDLAERRRKKQEEEEMGDNDLINPRAVKTMKSVVELFQTFSAMSKTPAQVALEEVSGKMMSGALQNAFGGGGPPKKDLLDTVLNSQFAYGVGQGIGNRGPELVESMGRTFGPQRAGDMIDGMMGRKQPNTMGPQMGALSPGQPGSVGAPSGGGIPGTGVAMTPEQQKVAQQRELLMTLDPNNPEHVSAYCMTQGDVSPEVGRKMLMMHQDEFVRQMKQKGQDISPYMRRTEMAVAADGSSIDGTVPIGDSRNDNVRQYRPQVVAQQPEIDPLPDEIIEQVPPQQQERQQKVQARTQQTEQPQQASVVPPELMAYMQQMNDCVLGLTNTVNTLQNDITEMKKKQEDREVQEINAGKQDISDADYVVKDEVKNQVQAEELEVKDEDKTVEPTESANKLIIDSKILRVGKEDARNVKCKIDNAGNVRQIYNKDKKIYQNVVKDGDTYEFLEDNKDNENQGGK